MFWSWVRCGGIGAACKVPAGDSIAMFRKHSKASVEISLGQVITLLSQLARRTPITGINNGTSFTTFPSSYTGGRGKDQQACP